MIESNRVEYKQKLTDGLEITSAGGLSVIKNREHFFQGYSNPVNHQIMRIYKDLEMVEHLGSGMNRILAFYKKENFFLKDIFLRVVFFSNRDKIKTNEPLSEALKKLLLIAKENPHSTKEQLMYSLNVSRATITRYIKQLKDKKNLERVGSDKSGYWKVLDA